MVREIIASKILPEGSLQLICGSARDILDSVTSEDVVTFTGSADTGIKLKSHSKIIKESVPFNMEADSLNCTVLAEDAVPGTTDFNIFIKEVIKEITVKAGQKCTAIRRIIVPEKLLDDVKNALQIPEYLLFCKVHDVLYIHELKNVSLLFLIDGFGTTSPKFLTEIFSPSVVTLDVSDGISSKLDNTPVIRTSTFLEVSPFS